MQSFPTSYEIAFSTLLFYLIESFLLHDVFSDFQEYLRIQPHHSKQSWNFHIQLIHQPPYPLFFFFQHKSCHVGEVFKYGLMKISDFHGLKN